MTGCPRCRSGPLDVAAVAKLLGIDPASVSRARLRQSFPPEDGVVGRSPYWWPETLAAYGKTTKAPVTDPKAE